MSRRTDLRAHRYIVDHVKPGTLIRRRVEMTNASEKTRKIELYPAAATVSGNEFAYADERTRNELSSWITLDQDSAELGPERTLRTWATISVPPEASAGERYAVIWAQVAGDADPTTNVRNVSRAGIRIYLSVGPGGEPASNFEISGLTGQRRPDGTPVLTAQVRNTGGRALDLAGDLSLSDGPGGLTAGPVRVEAGTLALGASAPVTVTLDPRLPDGPWKVRLRLVSGWTERTVEGQLTFGPTPVPATADGVPFTAVGGLVVALLILVVFAWYARRQRWTSTIRWRRG